VSQGKENEYSFFVALGQTLLTAVGEMSRWLRIDGLPLGDQGKRG
jgi:hypothetical protein